MRWIGRALLTFIFLGWLIGYGYPALKSFWRASQSMQGELAKARANAFFPLSRETWLVFDIPQNSGLFRIYSHAALQMDLPEEPVNYTIDYQWLDGRGRLLEQKQHHITTRAANTLAQLDLESQLTSHRALRFYDHQRSRPSRDHAIYFDARSYPEARQLQLRIRDTDAGIEQVGIRPYQQHQRVGQDIDIAWQRMSSDQRENLSRGSLYPSFLLSNYERRNMLATYWKPIGPLGVLDKDYRIDTLYQLDGEAPVLPPETPGSDGLFASPLHWVTAILPEDDTRYRIEWQSLPNRSSPGAMALYWQGLDSRLQRQWQDDVEDSAWEGTLDRGLLQVNPDQAGLIKLYQLRGQEKHDITPAKRYSKAFYCSPDEPLAYTLAPGGKPQPLRVDARAFDRDDQEPSTIAPVFDLAVKDSKGRKLYDINNELSRASYPYQHFADAAWVAGTVFEPLTRFLNASPDAVELHINCNVPILVNVYSRPWQHRIKRELPSQDNVWLSYDDREPAWFTLLPINATGLIRQKRYQSLLWYFQPLGQESILADERYHRVELQPEPLETYEALLLSAYEGNGQPRLDALGSAYMPWVEPETIMFAGRSKEKDVAINAVFLRENTDPQAIQVFVDHSLALETSIAGRSGRIRLPRMSVGEHHIEIRSDDTQWYISNTTRSGQTHLLRTAYATSPDDRGGSSLLYPVSLSGASSLLSFWLYTENADKHLDCQLVLHANGRDEAQPLYSNQRYRYFIDAEQYDRSYLLHNSKPEVYGPIKLSIPLGEDLPAQAAKAQFTCDQSRVYISAGLLSDGDATSRYFEEHNENN